MAQIFASERQTVPAPTRRAHPADQTPASRDAPVSTSAPDLAALQMRADHSAVVTQLARWNAAATQLQERGGAGQGGGAQALPESLRSGMEALSGTDMSAVKVHYNSSKPAAVNAHAYAQGKDIHLAAGQEKHLPHEAWHTVQQAQGRVRPTRQLAGVAINDDTSLEKEADDMGAKAQSGAVSSTSENG